MANDQFAMINVQCTMSFSNREETYYLPSIPVAHCTLNIAHAKISFYE